MTSHNELPSGNLSEKRMGELKTAGWITERDTSSSPTIQWKLLDPRNKDGQPTTWAREASAWEYADQAERERAS